MTTELRNTGEFSPCDCECLRIAKLRARGSGGVSYAEIAVKLDVDIYFHSRSELDYQGVLIDLSQISQHKDNGRRIMELAWTGYTRV